MEKVEIRPVDFASIEHLGRLLCSNTASAHCWCMWFIIPVAQYHAFGSEGNRNRFCELVASSKHPVGLIAYLDNEPVGWCAVGPRSRYARAIKTPTYKGREPDKDDEVWLLPCLFVRKEVRGVGLSEQLVRAAVLLAEEHGAAAIEAFPYSGQKRRSKETQVGFETIFARCGFAAIATPSPSRVLMRLEVRH